MATVVVIRVLVRVFNDTRCHKVRPKVRPKATKSPQGPMITGTCRLKVTLLCKLCRPNGPGVPSDFTQERPNERLSHTTHLNSTPSPVQVMTDRPRSVPRMDSAVPTDTYQPFKANRRESRSPIRSTPPPLPYRSNVIDPVACPMIACAWSRGTPWIFMAVANE